MAKLLLFQLFGGCKMLRESNIYDLFLKQLDFKKISTSIWSLDLGKI